jgi:hypothetical protein
VSNSAPDDPKSIAAEQPCANDPSGLVRVIVGSDGVVNIIDLRPWNKNPGPLPPHMREQLRRARRRREVLPDEEPPAAAG